WMASWNKIYALHSPTLSALFALLEVMRLVIIYEGFWSLPIRLQLFIGHFPRGSSGPKGVILCPLNNIHSSRNLYPQTEADCRMPRSTILSLSQNSGNLEKRA
ncbi:hypothetical protein KXW70_000386, partial [Aspergillus fumigatus]